jgi:hypothetical protein
MSSRRSRQSSDTSFQAGWVLTKHAFRPASIKARFLLDHIWRSPPVGALISARVAYRQSTSEMRGLSNFPCWVSPAILSTTGITCC